MDFIIKHIDIILIFIILVIIIWILKFKIFGKKENYNQGGTYYDGDEALNDVNRFIDEYNFLVSKFNSCLQRTSDICSNNQDLETFEELRKAQEDFLDLYPTCGKALEDIKKYWEIPNKFIEIELDIKEFLATMEVIIDRIIKMGLDSIDCSVSQKDEVIEEDVIKYFSGCNDITNLNKRYHALAKAFHPDNNCGDEKSFKEMSEEYETLKEKF